MHIFEKSTPSLAGVVTVTQNASVWTEVQHSIYVWGKRGVRGIRQCLFSQLVEEVIGVEQTNLLNEVNNIWERYPYFEY